MVSVDLTVTISVILGLAAVVVPTLGTIISCRVQWKIKREEMREDRRRYEQRRISDIYDAYAIAAGACVYKRSKEARAEFSAASAKAMMYAPKEIVSKMRELADRLDSADYNSAKGLVSEITEALRDAVKTK